MRFIHAIIINVMFSLFFFNFQLTGTPSWQTSLVGLDNETSGQNSQPSSQTPSDPGADCPVTPEGRGIKPTVVD